MFKGDARKVVFVNPDGSMVYDHIRNYDVFRRDELEFSITQFQLNSKNSETYLVGSTGYTVAAGAFTASYTPAGVNPQNAYITVNSNFNNYVELNGTT